MATQRRKFKSCCGSSAFIITVDKPLRKSQIDIFKQNGYTIPDNFFNSGIFYAQKGGLIATCAFGTNNINLRVTNIVKESDIDSFVEILEKAVGVK